ncbi:hypothetical protein BBJ28_00007515 [Nothophytophthora sp. Chile5]|nr:hypothetical protein BBJ28_00007515 [Nothophytophthora sp. Chile5]
MTQQDWSDADASDWSSALYSQDSSSANANTFDPDAYWRLDAETQRVFLELAPEAQGENVPLGELPELCRRMGRPIQDDHEQSRLLTELDTTNAMLILRHDFVAWLLTDFHAQELTRLAAEPRSVPIASPVWEEVVEPVSEADTMLGSRPTVFYYNTQTGESTWELPSLVRCLWEYLEAQETSQQETRVSQDGVPAFVRPRQQDDENREIIQELRVLFTKYDDDKSGSLDAAKFEDLCVRIGQPLQGLQALMGVVDPFSSPVAASEGEQRLVVSWEALRHYWVSNAPFQRRSKLPETRFAAWERVDSLHQRTVAVVYRHTTTLQERWSHPAMEQRVVDRLNQLFPSQKLTWTQKIAFFLEIQRQRQQKRENATTVTVPERSWDLESCWELLKQLDHPTSRRQHVQTALQQLQQRFAGASALMEASDNLTSLDEDVIRLWLEYCTKKVAQGGWEELRDDEGRSYFYHEVDGVTQWDPPQLQAQMTSLLSQFGGEQRGLSTDEQIARVFRQYDADESGEMTRDEFQHFYRALLGRGSGSGSSVSDAQVTQVFNVLDASGDGAVSLQEFQLWWQTKLQLNQQESEEAAIATKEQSRRELCRTFLTNAEALVLATLGEVQEEQECFESNLLPRLVALLGEFPLRGLAYRGALNELVTDAIQQLVSLERFLVWYDVFEAQEREKQELKRAKQRAEAELNAQHAAQSAAREKQRRHRRQQLTLTSMTQQATAMTELEAQQLREKKVAVLFKTFDTDGSGFLDEQELLRLTKALGYDMEETQVNRMMQVMDVSGDGHVSLPEFLSFWTTFEHRRPVVTSPVSLHQTRRDAVAEPVAAPAPHLSTGDAVASLAVSFEMVKDRALKLTLADLRGFLGDWRDDLLEKRMDQQQHKLEMDEVRARRELQAFIPSKTRFYGSKRLDVTWIEPEVMDCMKELLVDVKRRFYPPLKPDAAQTIQAFGRGLVTRQRVLKHVQERFQTHVDVSTRLLYFTDIQTGQLRLTRPIFPTATSSEPPFELDDCTSKGEKYRFDKRMAELRAKKRFYDQLCVTPQRKDNQTDAAGAKRGYHHRPLLAASAFYMVDIVSSVQQRLFGNIWTALRTFKPELALIELIARRRRRQLQQRSRDVASNLPLHYVIRHAIFPLDVVRVIVAGYPEALTQDDAFGMTPIHLAFREQRRNLELLELLVQTPQRLNGLNGSKTRRRSLWTRQTSCGDTPLHVAVRHRTSVGVLQWALRSCTGDPTVATLLNGHGESAFHACITQQQSGRPDDSEFSSSRARTAVLLFLKHFNPAALCSTATKNGDLPLHLAMDGFNQVKYRPTASNRDGDGWVWLVKLLLTHFPAALLVSKRCNGLLPVHLAIKYGLPEDLTVQIFIQTAQSLQQSTQSSALEPALLAKTTIAGSNTTLLHYALLHQPQATALLCLLIDRIPTACSIPAIPTGDLPLHLAAATAGVHMDILRKLCGLNTEGCRTFNAKRQLPLHSAITHDVNNVEKVDFLVHNCQELLLADAIEGQGLRALVLAANAKTPDYRVLLTLLDATPSRKLDTANGSAINRVKRPNRSVTPLYALSLRRCTPEITTHAVAKSIHDKFEEREDEDAYFLAMAKAKLRKKHYNPTSQWSFGQILELVERNPLDEALLQRALLATNEKLQLMLDAEKLPGPSNNQNPQYQAEKSSGYTAVVDAVTLNRELQLVRTVHQLMYEFPNNPRLQLLGQAILAKLLPTAFVRAAYKAKIDPYFNL